MLPRFNLALLPVSAQENESFYKAAEPLWPIADGYCLQPGQSLSHLTLCQFRAASEKAALQAIKEFVDVSMMVKNTGICIRMGSIKNGGEYWVEYTAVRHRILMDIQEKLYTHLTHLSLDILSQKPRDDYFPHFTLGRLSSLPDHMDMRIFKNDLINVDIQCIARLGLSDENGQFLKVIGP